MQEKIRRLSQYQDLRRECMYLRRQIERLDARLQMHGQNMNGMPRAGGGRDVLGDTVTELLTVRQQLQERECESAREMRWITGWINAVPDAHMRGILHRRYILGWSWRRIGVDMEVDETTARRRHNEFLKKCEALPEMPDSM